jgi:hypothetical protein
MESLSILAIALIQVGHMAQNDCLSIVVFKPLQFLFEPSEHVAWVIMQLGLFPIELITEVVVEVDDFSDLVAHIGAI